jgi:hypothetical protein
MPWIQRILRLRPRSRGFHLITDEVVAQLPELEEIKVGRIGESKRVGDVYVVSVEQPNKPKPLINTQFSETYPTLSPDGHWLTYCSDESGTSQFYVQPYPGPGKRVTVSTDGAIEPAWSRDGRELFYRNGDAMLSVSVKIPGTEFLPEKPVVLFHGVFLATTPTRMYDIAPDGRFLMIQPIPRRNRRLGQQDFPFDSSHRPQLDGGTGSHRSRSEKVTA